MAIETDSTPGRAFRRALSCWTTEIWAWALAYLPFGRPTSQSEHSGLHAKIRGGNRQHAENHDTRARKRHDRQRHFSNHEESRHTRATSSTKSAAATFLQSRI